MRESIESLGQTFVETLSVFNRKFRDVSELAYPPEQRTAEQSNPLIRHYIKGLVTKEMARAVLKSSPAILMEAMTTAIDSEEVEDALQRLSHWQEEPMDVSSIQPRNKPPMTVETLSRQLVRIMNSKLAKMEIQINQGQTGRRSGNTKSRTKDGKPIFFSCNTPGHVARHCPRRLNQSDSLPMNVFSIPLLQGRIRETSKAARLMLRQTFCEIHTRYFRN